MKILNNIFSAVVWTPYFPTVLDAWANKNHPNMLFLFYEDMKKVITFLPQWIFRNKIGFSINRISGRKSRKSPPSWAKL